jgi:hypothetical protein
MRLGLLGDIHAEDERLLAALQLFGRAHDAGALGVRGNHDRWLLEGTFRS